MPNLDDFELRPGDPGNPRRPPPDRVDPPLGRPSASSPSTPETPLDGPREPVGSRGPLGRPPAPAFTAPASDADRPVVDIPEDQPYVYESMRRGSSSSRAVGLVALILAGGLIAAFWMMSRRVEPPEPGTVAEEPAPEAGNDAAGDPARTSELDAPLPPLASSDGFVRDLVGKLSRHPALAGWLANAGLVRTFTAAVENASIGASPSPNLRFLAPREPYRVLEGAGADDGLITPDPRNYVRYAAVTEVFTSIDPQAAADVYRRVDGLLQEAYAELGYPDQRFETALAEAIETLLATPIPERAPELERHVNTYRYADPRLEELAPVQKQLLRMGPENARRIKAQLRRIAAELKLGVD
jgi:hypothetical protein